MKNLAVIGVGKWGRNIISTLESLPAARLKYVCARSDVSLRPYAEKYETVTDWRALLNEKDLDAVLVVTPPAHHTEIAVAFLKRGVSVFVEKPLAMNLSDAKKIKAAAKKGKVTVFVGHTQLYNPVYVAAKAFVKKSGKIGSIYMDTGNNGPFRKNLSALWDYGPHEIYQILDLMGGLPKTVSAWGMSIVRPGTNQYDMAYVKLVYRDVTAAFRVSRLDTDKHRKVRIIAGENAVVYDDALPKDKGTIFRGFFPLLSKKNSTDEIVKSEPKEELLVYGEKQPLAQELKAFLSCLERGEKPMTDVDQGIAVVQILEAVEKSIRTGSRPISI